MNWTCELRRRDGGTGYRTYFTTAADLAARCHRAAIEGRWATTMRCYAGPTLLVIGELGYLPLPGQRAATPPRPERRAPCCLRADHLDEPDEPDER